MKVLVLAAGYGTRLGALGEKLPKPLLPLGNGQTVLDHIVDHLRRHFEDRQIYIVTNKKFVNHFEKWKKERNFGGNIIIEPHERDEEKFGTIKGMHWAVSHIGEDDYLVLASDNVIHPFDQFLANMLATFENSGGVVVGAFEAGKEKIKKRFGNLAVDENGRITAFVEKPENPISPYAAMAVYMFPKNLNGKSFLQVLTEYLKNGNPDAPGNFIAYLVGKGYDISGNIFTGKWWDVGKVEDWKSAMEFFSEMQKMVTVQKNKEIEELLEIAGE